MLANLTAVRSQTIRHTVKEGSERILLEDVYLVRGR